MGREIFFSKFGSWCSLGWETLISQLSYQLAKQNIEFILNEITRWKGKYNTTKHFHPLCIYCKLVMTFCLWFCAITAVYFRWQVMPCYRAWYGFTVYILGGLFRLLKLTVYYKDIQILQRQTRDKLDSYIWYIFIYSPLSISKFDHLCD